MALLERPLEHYRTSLFGVAGGFLAVGTAWAWWTPEQATALAGLFTAVGLAVRDVAPRRLAKKTRS